MKKPHFLFCLVLLLFFSCDEVEEDSDFYITGRVVNTSGEGIEGVKIYYSDSDYVVTDRLGNWAIFEIYNEGLSIAPISADYVFTPEVHMVNQMDQGIEKIFMANEVESEEVNQIFNWFTNQQRSNGLLESTENGNIVSLYDSALAAMVFMLNDDYTKAENIFDFFNSRIDSELLVGLGGFSQLRDKEGNPNNRRWMGDNAWLLIALNNYSARTGSTKYNRLATEISKWLIGLQDIDGGLFGGYSPDGTKIHKITEGNIDAFNAVQGYTAFHEKILDYLKNERWDSKDRNLVAWVGHPQYLYALDLHSWSYCIFEDYPISTLYDADRFLNSKTSTTTNLELVGYGFDEDKDVIWLEGTGHMALAYKIGGVDSEADFYLKEMEKVLIKSILYENAAGFPYAANSGTSYGSEMLWEGADINLVISTGAWYIFAQKGFNPFEVERKKGIPQDKKFWLHQEVYLN
ncbi:MAG: hypothetical protein ACFB0A_08615 [Croceivirga sp.]